VIGPFTDLNMYEQPYLAATSAEGIAEIVDPTAGTV